MVEGLGFERYVAHGDDFGAGITAHLARRYPEEVAAVHLAPPGLPAPPKPWSEAESRHFQEVDAWFAEEGGYRHMHATKPSTLGAALSDSPVGLAAWIGEKVRSWASTRPDGESAFDRNLLLSTLTLYWVTNTIASSILLYWANGDAPQNALLADDPGPTPTTVSIFGGEAVKFPNVPRELGDRYYTVHHWAEYERGGHFPAVAEPELLVGILRDAFRPLRQRG
jgi:pimeloyl-ACP methyl ester carboxylesterase